MQALGRAVLAQAESGQISRMELRYASGQDYLYDVQVIPIGGEPRRYQVIAADITPRRTAEANLRASQERVQALMRHSHGIVGVLDAEGRILHAAGTTQRETGFSADQLTGRALIAFLHPGDRALLHSQIREALHSQIREAMAQPGVATPPFEVRGNPRFHPARVFECVLTDLREMPEVGGFLISGHDVTHRKQAEENLRRQHAEAALLNEVSQALSRLAPAEEVLNILATNLPRVLDATSIYVGLVDETQRELSFPLLLHQGERQPPKASVSRRKSGALARA